MTSLQNTKKCPTKSQQKITGILQKIKVKVSHLNILRVILICCVVKKENFITRHNLTLTPNTPPITTPPPLIFTLQLKVFSLFIHNRNAYFIFWTFLCIIVVKIKSLCYRCNWCWCSHPWKRATPGTAWYNCNKLTRTSSCTSFTTIKLNLNIISI
jgi:hypothetical protein